MNILSDFNSNEKIFLIYLIAINIITFSAFLIDKIKAKNNSWRIRESTLILLSILGGSSGALLAMVMCKHKINKLIFTIAIPIAFIIHRVLEIYIFSHLI
ncbi:MAG TPA: DUF1294 domain-containing protein [Tissierellia bacterium]|nr:DUF1294 domain-containing protein [Tissierellia bacterium]